MIEQFDAKRTVNIMCVFVGGGVELLLHFVLKDFMLRNGMLLINVCACVEH